VKTVFVEELRADTDLFDQPFVLLDVTQRKTRDGRSYILFSLGDNSGKIGGVYWQVPDEVVTDCLPGKVVLVTGDVRLYNKRLQVVAVDMQPFDPGSMADFIPASRRNQEEMIAELRQIIADLRRPLHQLLTNVLLDPAFLRRFADAPAAKMMHHAFVGGLLEHSLAMVPFCRLAAERYATIDRDLLIAGALLHDVGKVYSYDLGAAFVITDEERLVGHITRGVVVVETAIGGVTDFTPELRQQLVHLLVSHHGTLEWGSPIRPRTLEAVLLHQIDLLESRVQGFIDHVEAEPGDTVWTSRSLMFGLELKRG
jgi:3'-5' exoribonuclease